MGHKKADERETVIKWLEECDRTKKEPWLWDFKNCYKVPQSEDSLSEDSLSEDSLSEDSLSEDSLSEDSITAFLKYKKGEFKDTTRFCITGKKGSSADCDKEAIGLYQVLGWQNSAKDIIRGETMNSFLTTFNRAIRQSSNYKTLTKTLGIDNRKKRDILNYMKIKIISSLKLSKTTQPHFKHSPNSLIQLETSPYSLIG